MASRRVLGGTALFLLLWLSFVMPPQPPGVDLDSAWRMTLGHAFLVRAQFGVDLVLNHGPLGFLTANTYDGHHLGTLVLWQLSMAVVYASVFMLLARHLGGFERAFFYGVLVLLVAAEQDLLHVATVLALGLLLLQPSSGQPWLPLCAAVLFAVLALAKFTLCLAVLGVLVPACACDLLAGRRRRAGLLLFAFAAALLALWLAARQSLANLPAYLYRSLVVTLSYGEAMQINESSYVFWLGLTALLLLGAYLLLFLLTHAERRRGMFLAAAFAAVTYLRWKHGFVRADSHTFGFFAHCLFCLAAFPALMADHPPLMVLKRGLLAAAGFACLIGIQFTWSGMLPRLLTHYNNRLIKAGELVLRLGSLDQRYQKQWRTAAAEQRLPRTSAAIGGEPVDVLGHAQAVALLNDFNYRPRPVCQSYFAHAAELVELNERYYDSDRAPPFVLQRLQTIDARYPTLDDAGVLLRLFRRYRVVLEERGMLLWQRTGAAMAPPGEAMPLLLQQTVTFGQRIDLGSLAADDLWLTVDYRPSWLGRARALAYKAPIVMIAVTDQNGRSAHYRLVPDLARHGFILNPLLRDHAELARFANTGEAPRVQSFQIEVPTAERRYCAGAIDIELRQLARLVTR